MVPGSEWYEGVLAHEFQHMVHWANDRNEDAWVNEGLSELSAYLNGYDPGGFDELFLADPDVQLTTWPDLYDASSHYGNSYLFMLYFWGRFGQEAISEIVAQPANGTAGLDAVLSSRGVTFEDLRKMEAIEIPRHYRKFEDGGFKTPSGKAELISSIMQENGFDGLPDHREPPESPLSAPDQIKEYPLILTSGNRTPVYFHTEYRQLPWLQALVPDPTVDIHPQTAQELGIKQGDWVRVATMRENASMRANLTRGIHPRVVATVHGWAGKSNDNLLTDNKVCATAIGTTPLRGLLAKVYKETQGA